MSDVLLARRRVLGFTALGADEAVRGGCRYLVEALASVVACGTYSSSTRHSARQMEVYVGSVGHGVQWDTAVIEYHVVPVHRKMCKYTIIPSSPCPTEQCRCIVPAHYHNEPGLNPA